MDNEDLNGLTHASVIIVGGGVIGLSIAYHLGKQGVENVVVLERNEISSGTSWHAAGIVGPLRASMNLTRLAKYATDLFARLGRETGQATGYLQTGGLWLAQSQARLTELRRMVAMADINRLSAEILTPSQIIDRYPIIDTRGLCGGLWVEQDGQVNPVDLCRAYARGAKQNGVRILENATAIEMDVDHRVVKSVTLASGEMIHCDRVVNAAGCWARETGRLAGLNLPLASCEHMYVVTDVINDLPNPCPILRDLDSEIYIKGDSGKLVIGGFESDAKPWNPAMLNADAPYLMLDEDWDHIAPMIESAIRRIPVLEDTGIVHFMNGPESFTPDTRQLMGKVAELDNYFVAAGFNSIGIMSSAGVGKVMSEWISQDAPPMDLWEVDVQRFEPLAATEDFLSQRIPESVHSQFAMHWPYQQKKSGRNLMHSRFHEQFSAMGAVFGVSGIWERPLWFAQAAERRTPGYSYESQCWWPNARREAHCLQHHVGLIELSPFTKLTISGPHAMSVLQRCCTNNVDIDIGRVIYTTILNQRGGIESEHTVTRTAEEEFFLVSGAATRVKDVSRLGKLASGCRVDIHDRTFELAVLGLIGPKARNLLQSMCDQDLSMPAFAYARSKNIKLGDIALRATRISYAGELGYELYVSTDNASVLFDLLCERGAEYNLGPVGHYCLDGCRLEKGFLHWGHDIGPDDTPLEAALDFSVRFDKPFIGKQALLKQKAHGLKKHLLQFAVISDSPVLLLHDEPVYMGDKMVGMTTSGGLGFRSGESLCQAYINTGEVCTREALQQRQYTIQLAGESYPLRVLKRPVYDPENRRMKA